MTAKEMFEALNYEQTTNSNNLIEYTGYSNRDGYAYIIFNRTYEEYEVGYFDIDETKTKKPIVVSIKEHEAITKQMKELSWI